MFENLFTETSLWIGLAHAGLGGMYWTQVKLTYQCKSVGDISLAGLLFRVAAAIGFIMAAISISNPVMLVADTLLGLLGGAQVIQKLHYGGYFKKHRLTFSR